MKILFVLVLGACVLDNLAAGNGGQVVQRTECKKMASTLKHPATLFLSYKLQTRPIKAVLLTTKGGKKTCVDPKLDWVKSVMAHVDKQEQQKQREDWKRIRRTQKKP
ncbi:cytokine SCM-1 beta-like isoform X2 [Ambystoma mexicanum]|uniref:cytokine SCM-1 beta-like isoform X2 n=1 Tax=Ambystoma mexicanum TaxID=8296 RepID=UPI0037E7A1FB